MNKIEDLVNTQLVWFPENISSNIYDNKQSMASIRVSGLLDVLWAHLNIRIHSVSFLINSNICNLNTGFIYTGLARVKYLLWVIK